MLTLFIILGFILAVASSFSRPAPVVIVHERSESNPIWVILLIGLGIWVYTSFDTGMELPPAPGAEPKEAPVEEPEDSVDAAAVHINQAPFSHPLEIALPDTHINEAPPSKGGASHADHHDAPVHHGHLQSIILVKRFADYGKAALLQQHFSQWGMDILEIPDSETPYWNCVYIENEAEGRAKIREWYRHREDFEKMGLELTIIQIKIF